MSHRTTSGGGRRRGLRRFSSISPPERSAARPVPVGHEAPRRHVLHRQAQLGDRRLRACQLFERHLFEIHAAQLLAVGKGHCCVEFGLGLLGFPLRPSVGVKRLGQAPGHRSAFVLFTFDAQLRQHEPHHLLQQLGVAPEDVKGLVEDQPLVGPIDEHCVQCPIEIATIGNADGSHSGDGVDHLPRPDRQPCGAQGARKMHQIGEQRSAGLGCRWSRSRGSHGPRSDAPTSWLDSLRPSTSCSLRGSVDDRVKPGHDGDLGHMLRPQPPPQLRS